MIKRKIVAQELINNNDWLHLAKEFYRYTTKYQEKLAPQEWKIIFERAEYFIVECRYKQMSVYDISPSEYRKFLRFYTNLEVKNYDRETEFVFTEKDKCNFLKFLQER